MSLAFWTIKISNGKPAEVQPPEGYVLNIQQAAFEGSLTDKTPIVIHAQTDDIEDNKISAVIGTLRPGTVDQIALGLVFGYEVPVTFSISGESKAAVHLSGYFQPGPDADLDDDLEDDEDDEEDEDEDEEDEEDKEAPALKALEASKKGPAKVAPLQSKPAAAPANAPKPTTANAKTLQPAANAKPSQTAANPNAKPSQPAAKPVPGKQTPAPAPVKKEAAKSEDDEDEEDDDDEDDEGDDDDDDEAEDEDEDDVNEKFIQKMIQKNNQKLKDAKTPQVMIKPTSFCHEIIPDQSTSLFPFFSLIC